MKPSAALLGLFFVASSVLAADPPPNQTTQQNGKASPTPTSAAKTSDAKTDDSKSSPTPQSSVTLSNFKLTPTVSSTPSPTSDTSDSGSPATELSAFHLTGLPTIAGVGIPTVGVPDTAGAPFMQKSNLPDGTVFICVGAALGFFGACILLWRGLVAWSLHRSVKRAAMAQNLADIKAMSAVPGKKRGMYNVVGASSNMSLDRLSAAPTGVSKPSKPFAANPAGTPPKPSTSSLFFSPTAGGAAGLRDSMVNRSSTYLPAGYYAAGNAHPASGSPHMSVGGLGNPRASTNSLSAPAHRYSRVSPPDSPSLPPSRGYDRAPPSRDGVHSLYGRNSVATSGTPAPSQVYSHGQTNPSQLSLNVPGGTSAAGARAPSAYLEDLFENHGNGPRERF